MDDYKADNPAFFGREMKPLNTKCNMKTIILFIPLFYTLLCTAQAPLKTGPKSGKLMSVASTGPKAKMLTFEFSLDRAATVSAGTYKGGTLIKTIFSNKQYASGKHVVFIPFDPTPGITVKVLSNNIKYEWEGILANTSDSMSGPTVHHGYAQIYAALPYGDKLYASKYYSEGNPTQSVLKLSNIQLSDRIFKTEGRAYHQNTTCIATDGVNVYWFGGDGYKKTSYIFATKIRDNTEVIFPKGIPYKGYAGRKYKSVIDFDSTTVDANGIAVQRNRPYIFTARASKNLINVHDKTGAFVRSIAIDAPYGLSCDENDNLLVCTGKSVNRYTVNIDGTIELSLAINGLKRPISVSAKKGKILVADVWDHQVKAFNYKGESLWTLGQPGGQIVSASVANDKFFMIPGNASVAIQDDGSFWLADIGNYRLIHFSEQRKFIENILYTPHKYTCAVDPNDPTNVWSDYSKFKVDYSKPLKESWKFVESWRPQVDSIVRRAFHVGFHPVTLSNGRVYTLLQYPNRTVKGVVIKQHYKVFELTPEGVLRDTKLTFPLIMPMTLTADGSVHVAPVHSLKRPTLFNKYPLIGFDGANPIWGPVQTIATVKHPQFDDPNSYPINAGQITSNGTIVKYEHNQTPNTYHLAGIKIGDTAYSFRTQPSTTNNYAGIYPPDGSFDIGNGVLNAGNVAIALDNLILTGYKGEFWRNSQVNKWNVYHESGLMVGQFGVTGPEATYEGYPGMAGNVFTGSLVKNRNNYYLYHNDEGHLSGIHRWKITGTNSIVIQNIKALVVDKLVDTNAINLLKDIPYDRVLTDDVAGFNRYPKTENYTDAGVNTWKVMTNTRSSDRDVPEIAVTYAGKMRPDSSFVERDLGNNSTKSWKLTGKISVSGSYNAVNSFNRYDSLATGCYWEVLDQSGIAIFRLFSQQSKDRAKVNTYLNGQLIMADGIASFTRAVKDFNAFSIKCVNGIITFNYLGKTSTVKANGNPSKPNKFRLYFFSTGGRLNRSISVKELIFTR